MADRKQWTRVMSVAGAAVLAVSVAGCGGSSSSGGGGASGGDSKGPITFVTGKDNSGVWAPQAANWNTAHPNEKVTIKEQTDQADQQHDDIVQHFQAKDSGYDVVTVDVVWTAEFAAKGWLAPLKGKYAFDTTGFLAPTVKAATYNNTLYAAPWASDGGMLYYRKDLVKTPPKTLDEMWADCKIAKAKGIGCYAGQFAKYEGGTVNAAELINTNGGQIVDSSGKPTIDSPEAVKGLAALADHYKNGDIPKRGHHLPGGAGSRRRSRPASCCSCATGPTSTTWPRPTSPRRSRTRSASHRCRVSTVRVPRPWVVTARRSAPTPTTRQTALAS